MGSATENAKLSPTTPHLPAFENKEDSRETAWPLSPTWKGEYSINGSHVNFSEGSRTALNMRSNMEQEQGVNKGTRGRINVCRLNGSRSDRAITAIAKSNHSQSKCFHCLEWRLFSQHISMAWSILSNKVLLELS